MSTTHRPNILLIVSDDHAAPAISCYGNEMNYTPNIDRISDGGMRFNNCFCTNAICTPARASILTGKYSHKTGIKTLADAIDHTQEKTVAQRLHEDGYQTAVVGKWHLGHGGVSDPHGFDYWNVFPGQGAHINPEMIEMGERKKFTGYSADIVTDNSLNWLRNRETDQPFFLMTTYKATHDPFFPNPKHLHLYTNEIPEPPTFNDDYENRAAAAAMNTAKVSIMQRENHLPEPTPEGLEGDALKQWNYQCYMQNYLRCAHAIDENVGRLLDYLDAKDLAEDTIIIYSADHGFLLGDHGWYDKRFMYEESMRIPLLVRYPREIPASDVIICEHKTRQVLMDPMWVFSADNFLKGRSRVCVVSNMYASDLFVEYSLPVKWFDEWIKYWDGSVLGGFRDRWRSGQTAGNDRET